MELFKASHQWATRTADQRFWTLEEMLTVCKEYAAQAAESTVPAGSIRTEAADTDVVVLADGGTPARTNHWSFGQLARMAGAPADYLRKLPAQLASDNINCGLRDRSKDQERADLKLMFHANGSLILRALTSEYYERIWNYEVASQLLGLLPEGWRVPPARPATAGDPQARPATEADVLENRDGGGGLSINVGDMIAPAGIYASDHDMFVFMVNEDARINDGTPDGLSRGFFVSNSEVGAASLKLTTFLYRHVCGNHIVWGAENVRNLAIRHIGDARERSNYELTSGLDRYANQSAALDEARIAGAKKHLLGTKKEDVLEFIFKRGILGKAQAESAYKLADEVEQLDPRSAWGFAQGVTRLSQESPYGDARVKLDLAAGRVLQIAF